MSNYKISIQSCLDLTEAHITWGTKNVKKKYSEYKGKHPQ